jgi:hypothetical protein
MARERQYSKAERPDPIPGGSGRNPQETGVGASNATARKDETRPAEQSLMEEVVESKNMREAYRNGPRSRKRCLGITTDRDLSAE